MPGPHRDPRSAPDYPDLRDVGDVPDNPMSVQFEDLADTPPLRLYITVPDLTTGPDRAARIANDILDRCR